MDTIKDFAKFMKVSKNTIRKWIDKGMPTIKNEGTVRIDREEAIQWLKANKD